MTAKASALDLLCILETAVAAHPGGQKGWAGDHKMSPAFLNDVLQGRRYLSARIAAALGYRKTVVYEKLQP